CAAGRSGADCSTGAASTMEWDAAVAYCDALNWGGYTDWYLPDIRQLSGIVDAGGSHPSIDPTVFPATPSDWWFWSSSSYAGSASVAWYVHFFYGDVSNYGKANTSYVRCVRRGPWALGRFEPLTLSGDRVVRDTATGLEWQGCVAGQSGDSCGTGSATGMSWQAALAYCDGLSWAGHDDWRLPSRNELQSIVDYGRVAPAVDPTAFPATPSNWFWSSSSYAGSASDAWAVYFASGGVDSGGKANTTYVRCVRRGP
ncbi:MAG: DUF1566 domain-containing protein, partial [Myxococcota bacterium]|nr:DUF1566 domain-containing protein [Myxococcota bacterium]